MFSRLLAQQASRGAAPVFQQQRFISKYYLKPARENGQIPHIATAPGEVEKWTMTRLQANIVTKGIPIVFAWAFIQIPKNAFTHTYVQSDASALQEQLLR